jgi:hypothetical protein
MIDVRIQTSLVDRLTMGALAAVALVAILFAVHATGFVGTLRAVTPRASGDGCEFVFTGYAYDLQSAQPEYTLVCWDSNWNLEPPSPGARLR